MRSKRFCRGKSNFRSQIHGQDVTLIIMVSSLVLSCQDASVWALDRQAQSGTRAEHCLEGLKTRSWQWFARVTRTPLPKMICVKVRYYYY